MKLALWKNLEYGIKDGNYYGGSLEGLHEISQNKLGKKIPSLSLWLAVLIDAGKNRDVKFINDNGQYICKLCRINYNTIYKAFKSIWEQEDGANKNART